MVKDSEYRRELRAWLIIVLCCIVVLMVFIGIVYKLLYPNPYTFVTSDSPNGLYRLVILLDEPKPRYLKQSPWLMYLTIYERKTNRPLVGPTGSDYGDSACWDADQIRITWINDAVTVRSGGPSNLIHHGTISKGYQNWTANSEFPTATTPAGLP